MAAKRHKNSKNKKNSDKLLVWREIGGIVLGGLAVFLVCCLFTYHPGDPSFETVLATPPPQIHNLGKQIGAYLASLLFQVLGLGAWVVPAVVLLAALKLLFRPAVNTRFFVRTGLGVVLFLCVEIFLSIVFGRLSLPRYHFDAGGALVGGLLSRLLGAVVGPIGTMLLLLMTVMIVTMALTRVSYVALWQWCVARLRRQAGQVSVPRPRLRVPGWLRSLPWRPRTALRPAAVAAGPAAAPEPASEQVRLVQPGLFPEDIPITVHKEQDGGDPDVFEPISTSRSAATYRLPPVGLLEAVDENSIEVDRDLLRDDANVLMQKLGDFGVDGRIVEISPGPVITRFEFELASGVKLNRIVNLSDDLALALKAVSVRIAPIPGKSVVGIELPSKTRKTVSFREIVARPEFQEAGSRLTIGLGKDIAGGAVINDLARMPHLLVAGTTGSGKSVFVNTVICSILYKATPEEVRFLMVDPKRIELFPYDGIPHLLHPVVVDPKKAAAALRWAVEEMDRRYRIIGDKGTRNIVEYNRRVQKEIAKGVTGGEPPATMPYIVVVIDELADLMLIAARDVEGHIARLAQMARAAGIHLLVATQRPSVDILTGVIKANFPSRISFQVSSKVDSRTILDTMGAETLLGMGDMLFIPPGTSRLMRIHGAYISEKEITRITEHVKKQGSPEYDETIVAMKTEETDEEEDEQCDDLYDKAIALVADTRQASISMLQRKLRVGYNRAARMIERMERDGVVGPSDGVRPRDVLVNKL